MRSSFYLFLISFFLYISITGCKKDKFLLNPKAKLEFSTDTVIFDTVFTQFGAENRPFSVVKQLKVKNPYRETAKVSIWLPKLHNSVYRLNIDGQAAVEVQDYEIRGKDSIFILVQVYINPESGNNPFIVIEDLNFEINGSIQTIKLVAWGQNAHYYNEFTFDGPQTKFTWTNDKPHVIYNSILVDSGQTLTIEEGTQIYSHVNSWFLVRGTLIVKGSKDKPVIFQGDRLDMSYKDIPGQWNGLAFLEGSKDNEIDFANVRNAIVGVQAVGKPVNTNPNLRISHSKIQNHSLIGLLGMMEPGIVAFNTLVANCGQYTFAGFGGTYVFVHCTFATFNNSFFSRKEASFGLADSYTDADKKKHVFEVNYQIQNCIIYGDQEEELVFADDPDGKYNIQSISYTLLKTQINFTGAEGLIKNEDPLFRNLPKFDFDIKENSPARNKGNPITGITDDVVGNTRVDQPDLGAYEFH